MKNRSGAGLFSVLIVMTLIISSTVSPALASQMKSDGTVAHMGGFLPRHNATVEAKKIGNKSYQVAQILINAKPDTVWTALTSYDRAAEIYSNLKKLRIVNDGGDKKTISFTVASMGGLWKYDYVLNINEMQSAKRIEWTRHSGAFKANEGYWQLTPIEGDKTLVTYAKHIDGGILLPQAMISSELRKIMPEVLGNLRNAVMKEHIAMTDTSDR